MTLESFQSSGFFDFQKIVRHTLALTRQKKTFRPFEIKISIFWEASVVEAPLWRTMWVKRTIDCQFIAAAALVNAVVWCCLLLLLVTAAIIIAVCLLHLFVGAIAAALEIAAVCWHVWSCFQRCCYFDVVAVVGVKVCCCYLSVHLLLWLVVSVNVDCCYFPVTLLQSFVSWLLLCIGQQVVTVSQFVVVSVLVEA